MGDGGGQRSRLSCTNNSRVGIHAASEAPSVATSSTLNRPSSSAARRLSPLVSAPLSSTSAVCCSQIPRSGPQLHSGRSRRSDSSAARSPPWASSPTDSLAAASTRSAAEGRSHPLPKLRLPAWRVLSNEAGEGEWEVEATGGLWKRSCSEACSDASRAWPNASHAHARTSWEAAPWHSPPQRSASHTCRGGGCAAGREGREPGSRREAGGRHGARPTLSLGSGVAETVCGSMLEEAAA